MGIPIRPLLASLKSLSDPPYHLSRACDIFTIYSGSVMPLILEALIQILQKPIILEIFIFAAPLWIALIVSLVIGWAWRPRWVVEVGEKVGVAAAVVQLSLPSCISAFISVDKREPAAVEIESDATPVETGKVPVGAEDLDYLCRIMEERDGGKPWIHMMDRSLSDMAYQAWWRDPENHPPRYRSRTVYEDVTPELVRDFFWDDEFWIKNGWDDILLYHETLEECPTMGTLLVHWVQKFSFFCSDKEYTIGRRNWDLGGAYYCVTKGRVSMAYIIGFLVQRLYLQNVMGLSSIGRVLLIL